MFSTHLLASVFRFVDCIDLEQHPCMGFSVYIS